MSNSLRDIIAANRDGARVAIPSVCSAHPDVLRASLTQAQALGRDVVIEATSNQVNQFGGYTGMTPTDFVALVYQIADDAGVDRRRIIFGGDHLGPQAWRAGDAATAMGNARQMVADYVRAGFGKIHLDCSEGCEGEDPQVGDALAASRAADLAEACLDAADDPRALCFVIGTEVPPPGGARADDHGDIAPTDPDAARATIAAHRAAFSDRAWAQVVGLVVQPGVEFAPMHVHHMPLDRDTGLRDVMMETDGLCLEAHSTDYQFDVVFERLADMGFAFQKVGPALTLAFRQAVYALDHVRVLAGWAEAATVQPTMEQLMLEDPSRWQGHYAGTEDELRVARHFGLADRIRYYWPQRAAQVVVAELLSDLANRDLPDPLLAQCFGSAVLLRASGLEGPQARRLIDAQIQEALAPYFFDDLRLGGDGHA